VNKPPAFPFAEGPRLTPPVEYHSIHARAELPEVCLRGGQQALLVCRHADVRTVLGHQAFSRQAFAAGSLFARAAESLALMQTDPPVHSRRRGVVAPLFTARRAEQQRPKLEALAGKLIADIRTGAPVVDLLSEFCVPFTMGVISDMLGVPEADRCQFRPWVNLMMSAFGHPKEDVAAAHAEMQDYFTDLVDSTWAAVKAGSGVSGLIADLGRLSDDERDMTREETIVMSSGLLIAGYESTSNQLGSFVYLLLSERQRWEFLLECPDAINSAIEELLRWTAVTTTGGAPHVATEDVELSTTTVRAGQTVVPLTHTANWDPEVFGAPERLDLTRADNPHVAFGYGRHRCLGAELARAELRVALACLLRELPELTLSVPESELNWRSGMQVSGLWELPVRWTSTEAGR
jgi:nocardicin N-oxygenase